MKREISTAIRVLCDAKSCAEDLGDDIWNFAVEIADLRSRGVSHAMLRWLEARRLIDHREETTGSGEMERQFGNGGRLLSDRSCFVITAAGTEYGRTLGEEFGVTVPFPPSESQFAPSHPAEPDCSRPQWDWERKQLKVADKLIKEYKLPSPNQETILMAFQEEEWPTRIDDPLPPPRSGRTKARLNNTIKSLNRNQKHRLLKFRGDGTGKGVVWEFAS